MLPSRANVISWPDCQLTAPAIYTAHNCLHTQHTHSHILCFKTPTSIHIHLPTNNSRDIKGRVSGDHTRAPPLQRQHQRQLQRQRRHRSQPRPKTAAPPGRSRSKPGLNCSVGDTSYRRSRRGATPAVRQTSVSAIIAMVSGSATFFEAPCVGTKPSRSGDTSRP